MLVLTLYLNEVALARTFNGTSDKVVFGKGVTYDNCGPYTALCLVRPTANIVDERQIFDKMDSSYIGTMFLAASGNGTNNNILFSLIGGTVALYSESVASTLVVNSWNVCVCTFNALRNSPGTELIKLYTCVIGGTLTEVSYTSQTTGSSLNSDVAADLTLASRDPGDATFFAGGLSDCALWNRVLNSTELNMLGKGYSPLWIPSGLIMYSPVFGLQSPEPDLMGGTSGTVTGTSLLTHPPVIYSLDAEEQDYTTTVYV